MANLQVTIAGVPFKNPLIAASGCYGFGAEYESLYPLSTWGGISLKGTTLEARDGNPPPRIAEGKNGILNSVGLQNPGADALITKELPRLQKENTVIISNVAGSTVEDYIAIAEKLSASTTDMIELNISCPNVKHGGAAFGANPKLAFEVVNAVKKVCQKPLIVKLTPNVTSITEIAKAVEDAGADAVSLINTLLGMRIDIKTRRPILKNNVGGMSGPAVFPLAVRMVWEVSNAVKVPVIGLGGISTYQDAIEMMMAGASAVQIGSILFHDPMAPVKILAGLEKWLDRNNIQNVASLTGMVNPW